MLQVIPISYISYIRIAWVFWCFWFGKSGWILIQYHSGKELDNYSRWPGGCLLWIFVVQGFSWAYWLQLLGRSITSIGRASELLDLQARGVPGAINSPWNQPENKHLSELPMVDIDSGWACQAPWYPRGSNEFDTFLGVLWCPVSSGWRMFSKHGRQRWTWMKAVWLQWITVCHGHGCVAISNDHWFDLFCVRRSWVTCGKGLN